MPSSHRVTRDAASVGIAAEAFFPLPPQTAQQHIARPAISYWRHVWLRFRQSRLALGALAMVMLLLAFAILGPLLWRADPTMQSIGSRSLGPVGSRVAQLVDWQPWQPQDDAWAGVSADVAVVTANTEFVRLLWQPVTGARYYAVYRQQGSVQEPGQAVMGIPLDEVEQPWLEDRLDLKAADYVYTLLAYDEQDNVIKRWQKAVRPVLAIDVLSAQLQGLIAADRVSSALVDGTLLTLPAHPLGTDHMGRDLLARLMLGGGSLCLSGWWRRCALCCSVPFMAVSPVTLAGESMT